MNIALICAAGNGTRMGSTSREKQFLLVNEKPLFIYAVEQFEKNPHIDAIVIITNVQYLDEVNDLCNKYQINKLRDVVEGGSTRQESVFNGLSALKEYGVNNEDIVLIHDAARPLVSQRIIDDSINECQKSGAVDTVIEATDSLIKSVDGKAIDETLNRNEIYMSQTPQTFKFGIIYNAHLRATTDKPENVTDDIRLVKLYGNKVSMVKGEKSNFKITTPEDLDLFEKYVK